MDITLHSFWTLVHGMGFGALYLLACSGAFVELSRRTQPAALMNTHSQARWLHVYLFTMVVLAWGAVLTGTYLVYPWYRAAAPAGTVDFTNYPQLFLKSSPSTVGWHSFAMEWKEHVAWLTPLSITMVAAIFYQYGQQLARYPSLRRAVLWFTAVSFLAAAIAGFSGAMINKYAPVQGGTVLHWMHKETP